MDLDDIKKVWNEVELLREQKQMSDEKIKMMLKNEGKSALDRLTRLSKIGMIILIPLGLFMCLNSYKFFEAGGYYPICPLFMLLLCIASEPFEIYIYRLLKGIDLSTMTVKEVSTRILKYQNIVKKAEFYGIILFIIYMAVWLFLHYKLMFGGKMVWGFIIFTGVIYMAGVIAIPILYKKLYYNNINKIKESLKELEEFDQ